MAVLANNSVELWAKEFEKLNTSAPTPTTKQGEMYIKAFFQSAQLNSDKKVEEFLKNKQLGYASVMYLRINACHTYKATPAVLIFLSESGIIDNFGKSTMVVNYMQYIAHKFGLKVIDIKELGMNVFPHGYPSEEQWQKMWELQKLSVHDRNRDLSDNMLDYPKCMKSLMTEEEIKKRG